MDAAFKKYLDSFTTLAQLKIVGAYHRKPPANSPSPGLPTEALFLVGCTRLAPYTYHYRQCDIGLSGKYTWQPWVAINLQIKPLYEAGDTKQIEALLATGSSPPVAIQTRQSPITPVTPVFALGRLFLFWPEFSKTGATRPASAADVTKAQALAPPGDATKAAAATGGGSPEANAQKSKLEDLRMDYYMPQVKYSYLNFGGQWTPPQVNLNPDRKDLDIFELGLPEWQTVAVQGVKEFEKANKEATGRSEESARVMVVQSDGSAITSYLGGLPGQNNTWSFWLGVKLPEAPADSPDATPRSFDVLNYADGGLVVRVANKVALLDGVRECNDVIAGLQALAAAAGDANAAVQKVAGATRESDTGLARTAAGDAGKALRAQAASVSALVAAVPRSSAVGARVVSDVTKGALEADAKALAVAAEEAVGAPLAGDPSSGSGGAAGSGASTGAAPNGTSSSTDQQSVKTLAQTAKTINDRLQALVNKLTTDYIALPKYRYPNSVTLAVSVGGGPPASFDLTLDPGSVNWRHVVIRLTQASAGSAYRVDFSAYDWGAKQPISGFAQATLPGKELPGRGFLRIGRDAGANGDRFAAYLSNVCTWGETKKLRFSYTKLPPATEDFVDVLEPARHLDTQPGLELTLPLNQASEIKVAASALTFAVPKTPAAEFSNLQQERLIAFFGKKVYSLRGDMIADAQVTLTLAKSAQPVQVLQFRGNQLMRAVRLGIPLEDHGVGDKAAFKTFFDVSARCLCLSVVCFPPLSAVLSRFLIERAHQAHSDRPHEHFESPT